MLEDIKCGFQLSFERGVRFMNITLVRGFGKCIECGNMTSYQMWVGKMQFYFCDRCTEKLYYTAHNFLYENKEAFKLKEMKNQTKQLIKRGTTIK